MNLQNSNSVSLIAGNANLDAIQKAAGATGAGSTNEPLMLGAEGVSEAFNATLLQQLAILKQTPIPSTTPQINALLPATLEQTTPELSTLAVNSAISTPNPLLATVMPAETVKSIPVEFSQALVNSSVKSSNLPSNTPVNSLANVKTILLEAKTTAPETVDVLKSTTVLGDTPTLRDDTPMLRDDTSTLRNDTPTLRDDTLKQLKAMFVKLDLTDELKATQTTSGELTSGMANIIEHIEQLIQPEQKGLAVANLGEMEQKIVTLLDTAGVKEQLLQQPVTMHKIAALLGKELPTAKQQKTEPTVDETLQAIASLLAGQPINLPVEPEKLPHTNTNLAKSAATTEEVAVSYDSLNLAQIAIAQATVAQPVMSSEPLQSSTGAIDANQYPVSLISAKQMTSKSPKTNGIDTPIIEQKTNVKVGSTPQSFNINSSQAVTATKPDSAVKNTSELDLITLQASNEPTENIPKEGINRLASDMMQLEQQLGTDSKVTTVTPMTKHVYSPEWNTELGSKIVWMTGQNITSADIKLNPEHLGPISIHIDMKDDQANISFTALNSGVKEMLEASIPKLREMLSSQQLQLVDVNVTQNSFSGQGQPQTQSFGQNGESRHGTPNQESLTEFNVNDDVGANEVTDHIEQSRAIVTNGLVSYYA